MSITRHTSYNLVGSLVPIVVALVSIPLYLNLIGEQRYAVLALAWLLLGYFSVFDLGLGRAAAQRISVLDKQQSCMQETFWTATLLNLVLGCVGGLLMWPAADYFFTTQFQIDSDLRPEVLQSLPWLVLAVPVATVTGVLNGALQGVERFGFLNLFNSIGSILFQALPVLAAFIWGADLNILLPVAIGARLFGVIFLFLGCLVYVAKNICPKISKGEISALWKYGSWVTISSLVNPIMVAGDRVLIGAISGANAVTQYTVPYQLAERSTIFSNALSFSLFPKLAKGQDQNALHLSITSIQILTLFLTPVVALMILLSKEILVIWISIDFANRAFLLLQLLMMGFWFNSLSKISLARLLASGNPKTVAGCQAVQVIPYFITLAVALNLFDIIGAAITFVLRLMLDHVLLSGYARTLGHTFSLTLVSLICLLLTLALTHLNILLIFKILIFAVLVFVYFISSFLTLPARLKNEIRSGASLFKSRLMMRSVL